MANNIDFKALGIEPSYIEPPDYVKEDIKRDGYYLGMYETEDGEERIMALINKLRGLGFTVWDCSKIVRHYQAVMYGWWYYSVDETVWHPNQLDLEGPIPDSVPRIKETC